MAFRPISFLIPFLVVYSSPATFWQCSEMNRADGDALQIEDVVPQKLCRAADLTVFPFAHDQL